VRSIREIDLSIEKPQQATLKSATAVWK